MKNGNVFQTKHKNVKCVSLVFDDLKMNENYNSFSISHSLIEILFSEKTCNFSFDRKHISHLNGNSFGNHLLNSIQFNSMKLN